MEPIKSKAIAEEDKGYVADDFGHIIRQTPLAVLQPIGHKLRKSCC